MGTNAAEIREMMAELDAIAAERGIKWTGAEVGGGVATAERTRYAKPGQRCGRGTVRILSPKQVRFIKRLMAERDTTNLVRLPGSEDIEHMSLRGARDLIDRLLGCPELPAERREVRKVTAKQAAFIASLVERTGFDWSKMDVPTPADLPFERGRKAIDYLLKLQDSQRIERDAAKVAEAEAASAPSARTGIKIDSDGMYRNPTTGEIFKVQKAVHGSGHLYAKRLIVTIDGRDFTSIPLVDGERAPEAVVSSRFEMARGMVFKILPEWRMSMEEAKQFGALYGMCVRCGATLTREESIERAMGPVCAGKL